MPRGTCTIFNWNGSHNIKSEFGVSLSDGAISTLLAPPAAKQRISNESRLENGKRVDTHTPTRFASRELNLEMHMIAATFHELVASYRAFFQMLTYSPEGIILEFSDIYGLSGSSKLVYRLQYLSCTPFAVYNGTLAKFVVRFEERNPTWGIDQGSTLTMPNNSEEDEE